MASSSISNLLKDFLKLSTKEREEFIDFVTEHSAPADEKALIETRFENGYECPHCGAKGKGVSKFGKTSSGRQRFKCQHCGKTFSATTGGVLYYSKKPIKIWREYVSCFLHGFSTRKTADILDIHRNTAFLWRHKICDSLKNILAEVSLSGLVEADETYYRVSYKGSAPVGRKPRKRGSSIFHVGRKRGLSSEQVCVPCAVNRSGQSVAKIASVGKASYKGISAVIVPFIEKGATICSDGERSYSRIAKENGYTNVCVEARFSTKGGYSIQHINSYHRTLADFVDGFWGVSTKHLNNYLLWHNFANYAKETYGEKSRLLVRHLYSTRSYTRRVEVADRPAIPYICEGVRKVA